MEFSISIPQVVDDGFDLDGLRRYLERAEDLGFAGAWTVEQVVGTLPQLSPLEVMAVAATCTRRMRIGCGVLISTLRSPLHLAKSVATLDHLSGGRIEVGLGSGGRRPFAAFGVEAEGYISRFTEGFEAMRAVWTQERATLDGRFFRFDGMPMEPKPVQQPYPPVWFGGSHPNALRRAVRYGDGFLGAGSQTTAAFADQVRTVRAEMDRQGRALRIAKRIYIAVDDDADRARNRISVELDRMYGFFGAKNLLPVAVAGTVEDCVRGVQEVADAGAEMILLHPLYDDAQQMERLSAEVIPRLGAP